jgi:peptide/nickel transport system substrate-binding protein
MRIAAARPRTRLRLLAPLLVAVAAVAAVGCGDDQGAAAVGGVGEAGEGGTLVWALAERPASLDPLFADSPSERLVSRQIYEPLVARLSGPFDDARDVGGLAATVERGARGRIWRLHLRSGVRFQDRTPFNAAAVLAHFERWQSQPLGSGIRPAPEVLADSPKPGLVRFILSPPDPGFGERLASPRLGIVSPRALAGIGPAELTPSAAAASGTGPFELRERERDRMLLARNTDWWGSERGLGPAIDQLELTVVEDSGARVGQLAHGLVQVADDLGADERRRVREHPLLTVVPEPDGVGLGVERSVRGIPADEIGPPLNTVWLTTID